jgi:hypothetical protein
MRSGLLLIKNPFVWKAVSWEKEAEYKNNAGKSSLR